MTHHWSTLQLTEYFSTISGSNEEDAVLQLAVERATEALEAEVALVVIADTVRATWGFGADTSAAEALARGGIARSVELPGMGAVHTFAARLGRGTSDFLVVGRSDEPLDGAERQTVQAMAQLLVLVLRNVRALNEERKLREHEQILLQEKEREAVERLRLVEELSTRQRLLEQLLTIQQAVSARRPLDEVLDAVTTCAAELLSNCPVALVLADPSAPQGLVVVSGDQGLRSTEANAAVLDVARRTIAADATTDARSGRSRLIAVPVSVGKEIAGCLVAVLDDRAGTPGVDEQQNLLAAFAQQASLAITDARTVEAVTKAQHDPVTGLPNRTLFLEQLSDALAEGRDDIVLFIDLDRFKAVNDSLGHRAGDDLLAAVSRRITECLRPGDTAARIGGDEFAVLLRDVALPNSVAVAERLVASLRQPFRIASRDVLIGASVGVADRNSRHSNADDLLSNADVAMYAAKKGGASQVVVFEQRMLTETVARLDLLADLQRALHQGDLRLHYQPLVDLGTLRPVGMEALMRWTCARRGSVSPADFIVLAEESDLIVELGRWAIQEGVRQIALWATDYPELRMNLNIAARQLLDRDFLPHLAEVLVTEGVRASSLTIELTETAMMRDPELAAHQLSQVKDLGVRISVDDFGTGYSSLSYLRRFPVDELKIDRSFVGSMHDSTEDLAVVRSVIQLGHALGLETVAEGIEDGTQLTALRQLGCDLGQGYHLARPLPAPDASDYLVAAHPGRPWADGEVVEASGLIHAP